MSKLIRFQFDITPERSHELDELASQLGVSKKDLINNALTMLKWAIRHRRAGRAICSIQDDSDDIVELEMPILDAATPPALTDGINPAPVAIAEGAVAR